MTAVEFLSEKIRLTNIEGLRFQLWDAIEQAKEMEKQQQGYSEEDMMDYSNYRLLIKKALSPKEWFEEFKNK